MFFVHGLIIKVNISHNVMSLFGMLFCIRMYFLDAIVSSVAFSSLVILNQKRVKYSHENEQKSFGFCCEIGFRLKGYLLRFNNHHQVFLGDESVFFSAVVLN